MKKKYTRLSISKLKPEFTGWDHYTELLEQINSSMSLNPERDKAFFAILFELGCRVREVLGKRIKPEKILITKKKKRKQRLKIEFISPPLKRSNFLFTKPNRLIVTDIPILKKHKKFDHTIIKKESIPINTPPSHRELWHKNEEGLFERKKWKTKRLYLTRRIEIPLDEPLLKYVVDYIKNCDGILFNRKYDYYYQLCRKLNPLQENYPKVPKHIFPHWWRSQRACQLAAEYGFTLHKLLDFFQWKDIRTAQIYANLAGTLGDEMSSVKTTWRK